ncbi:FAD-dependent oxidoreductase [Microbacterium sp. M]|uniref:FAD-dependent oxidoreductase n=1 Tax=Microbacterium sp. M TaxID=3377125 RepID=UPI003864B676
MDDVDPAREGGVDEVGEVCTVAAGVRAEVQLGVREEHPASVSTSADVVVIGAGVIGLAIAWELVRAGRDVRIIDPSPASGATYAAAGMIAPISEERLTEPALHALAVASASRYPAFVATLPDACGYEDAATLLVAVDDADRRMLDDVAARHPDRVEHLTTRETRRLEPLLGPRLSAVRRVHEHRIDPRALAARLRAVLGDRIVRKRATGLRRADTASPVTGVDFADGTAISAYEVVVAAALGSTDIAGMPADLRLRPVYGDILRLGIPDHLRPLLAHTVRAHVRGASVYLVPRRDGTVVIGATQREHGGPAVSAGGVYELLRDAAIAVPAVAELTLHEVTARPRPVTPDNAPLLGRAAPGLIIATGFGRHGVMLAPIAAAAVRALVVGDAPPAIESFRPDRFTGAPGSDAPGPPVAAVSDAEPRVPHFPSTHRAHPTESLETS